MTRKLGLLSINLEDESPQLSEDNSARICEEKAPRISKDNSARISEELSQGFLREPSQASQQSQESRTFPEQSQSDHPSQSLKETLMETWSSNFDSNAWSALSDASQSDSSPAASPLAFLRRSPQELETGFLRGFARELPTSPHKVPSFVIPSSVVVNSEFHEGQPQSEFATVCYDMKNLFEDLDGARMNDLTITRWRIDRENPSIRQIDGVIVESQFNRIEICSTRSESVYFLFDKTRNGYVQLECKAIRSILLKFEVWAQDCRLTIRLGISDTEEKELELNFSVRTGVFLTGFTLMRHPGTSLQQPLQTQLVRRISLELKTAPHVLTGML